MTTSFTPDVHRPDATLRREERTNPGRQAYAVGLVEVVAGFLVLSHPRLAAVALQRLATAYGPRPLLWPLRRPSGDVAQRNEGER